MFRRHRKGPWLRTAPVEPGTGTPDNGGAPTAPPAAPAAPAPFDPNTLAPEVKAYIEQEKRKADERARTGTRDNAAKQATDELTKKLAEALGIAPKEADPAKLTAELSALKARNAELLQDAAIAAACSKSDVKADADLVGALLARQGKLKDLDPDAADFTTRMQALVAETVAANPRLKLETAPAAPAAGGSAPVAPMSGGNGGEGRVRPNSISEALVASRAAKH
jgi:hypothetical protein